MVGRRVLSVRQSGAASADWSVPASRIRWAKARKRARPPQAFTGLSVNVIPSASCLSNGVNSACIVWSLLS